MKKYIKLISLVLSVALIAVIFSGCKSLDTRKKNQAFWNNKNRTEIVLGGDIYKLLKNSEYFSPDVKDSLGTRVTDKDVPVLLAASTSFGTEYYTDKKREIIRVYNDCYARSDVYEKYEKLISEYKLDRYATFVDKKNKNGGYTSTLTLLTSEEGEIIKNALLSAKEERMPDDDYTDAYMDVYEADKSLLFTKYNCALYVYHTSQSVQILKEDRYYDVDDQYRQPLSEIINKYFSRTAKVIE